MATGSTVSQPLMNSGSSMAFRNAWWTSSTLSAGSPLGPRRAMKLGSESWNFGKARYALPFEIQNINLPFSAIYFRWSGDVRNGLDSRTASRFPPAQPRQRPSGPRNLGPVPHFPRVYHKFNQAGCAFLHGTQRMKISRPYLLAGFIWLTNSLTSSSIFLKKASTSWGFRYLISCSPRSQLLAKSGSSIAFLKAW